MAENSLSESLGSDVVTALEENYCVVVACKTAQIQDIVARNLRIWLPEPISIIKTNPML